MKSILYILFIVITTIGGRAQNNSEENLIESTKVKATEIAQELNFNDSKTLYLYRAMYSTAQTMRRANDQLFDANELKEIEQKIKIQFDRMLQLKFDETEIANIKRLIAEKE